MTTANVCPQCGKPLPSDGPPGQCPACLFRAALPGQSALESAETVPPDASPEVGAHLKYFGDYELLEEIARGGMGVVWKARQTSLKRDVAVKMIRAGALASSQEVQRFLREAEAAANLQHPHIVAIHEVGEYNSQHYFSMDHVAGRDLGALVKDGPLAPQRAARYVKIIAEAIHFAHQRGILHRDLKPQNVLIDAEDQPRITDFGLAKILKDDSELTQTGVVMGSPSYMPPEQADGRSDAIGPASDVYSLGAMLYELLTGRPPFRGATPLATLHEVLESEPVALRRLRAGIPVDLETICLKCLAKAPSARYSTARALAEDLDRYLKGEPILAWPASLIHKAVSWGRRHPGTLAALGAFVLSALLFGIYDLYEENAFLRAQQADPHLVRHVRSGEGTVLLADDVLRDEPGPRFESLQRWIMATSGAVLVGFFFCLFLIGRARGLSFKDWLDPRQVARAARQPLGKGARITAVCLILALVGCGIMVQVTAIQAHVWEAEPLRLAFLGIFGPLIIAPTIMSCLIWDHRLFHYGLPSRRLSADQLEPIRRALEDFDVPTAIQLYREAAPDAGFMEADQYVRRLAESLREQHPGKFVPPPLALAGLNWPGMLMGATIAAVAVVLKWVVKPPTNPALFAAEFTGALLMSMALTAGMRVQGLWKRMLLLAPGILVVSFMVGIRSSSAAVPPGSLSGYFWGIVAGFLVMSGGLDRRRLTE